MQRRKNYLAKPQSSQRGNLREIESGSGEMIRFLILTMRYKKVHINS